MSDDDRTIESAVTVDGRSFVVRAKLDDESGRWRVSLAEVAAPAEAMRWRRSIKRYDTGIDAVEAAAAFVARIVHDERAFGDHAPNGPTYEAPF